MASKPEDNELTGLDDTIEATVSVSFDISPFEDDNALFNVDEIADGIFTDYDIQGHYYKDAETYMMPVGSPGGFEGDSVAFVKLAETTKLWIVDWTAEKVAVPPSMPDPNVGDTNLVFLGELMEPRMLMLKPNGTDKVYRISGTYVYGYKNPSGASMYFGRPPWMDRNVDCGVPPKYKQGIITCSTSTQGGDSGSENQSSNPSQVGQFPAGTFR